MTHRWIFATFITLKRSSPFRPRNSFTQRATPSVPDLSVIETRGGLLKKLEELYRLFGYFNRWNSQIQERVVQLTI